MSYDNHGFMNKWFDWEVFFRAHYSSSIFTTLFLPSSSVSLFHSCCSRAQVFGMVYSCMSSPFSVAILSNTCFFLSPGIDFVLVGKCSLTKKRVIIIIALTKYWKQYSTEIRDKRTFLTVGTIGRRVQLSLSWTGWRSVRDYILRLPQVNYPI